MLTGDEINGPSTFLVFLNGLIIGIHVRPLVFVERLRELRRAGRIGEFISVYINENQKAVYVASDGGRVCRPLLIVDKKTSRILLTDEHIKALTSNSIRLEDLLASGIIEYVDVNEENNCLVGLIEYELTAAHTHMEIDPMTILGEFASSDVCVTLTHSLITHSLIVTYQSQELWLDLFPIRTTIKVRATRINAPWASKRSAQSH